MRPVDYYGIWLSKVAYGSLGHYIRPASLQYAFNVLLTFFLPTKQSDRSGITNATNEMHATLVVRVFAVSVFAYPWFYFSNIRSISILSAATVETVAQVHWVARAFSLTHPTILTPGTANEGLSWCNTQKIHGNVIRFPFYAFSIYAAIRRNANPAYNQSHLDLQMRRICIAVYDHIFLYHSFVPFMFDYGLCPVRRINLDRTYRKLFLKNRNLASSFYRIFYENSRGLTSLKKKSSFIVRPANIQKDLLPKRPYLWKSVYPCHRRSMVRSRCVICVTRINWLIQT
jgi:hypothetical protein